MTVVPSELRDALRAIAAGHDPAASGRERPMTDLGNAERLTLNRALHTIVLSLRRVDPETKAYIARRVGEGKSEREAVRCLKRYLARSLFRMLEATVRT